jgi:RNA polymerase sigma-70 factor (ECF subfamily)
MVSILALQKVGHRADAEDIVQEAFVRAYRALETLRDPDKFGAWVYHIALKLCIDWVRKRERRDAPASLDDSSVRSEASGQATSPAPLQILLESEEERKVLSAIGDLPDKYRLIVTLRYVRKLSYKEIADHLGEPAGTVANRIHRATKMLKDSLGIWDGGPLPPEEEAS